MYIHTRLMYHVHSHTINVRNTSIPQRVGIRQRAHIVYYDVAATVHDIYGWISHNINGNTVNIHTCTVVNGSVYNKQIHSPMTKKYLYLTEVFCT